ncbi:MAG: hypothetical protein J6T10_06915 [Methanobrevibacter sp.]|nr:hypothetical protein [Methanobrevibacter sp.]
MASKEALDILFYEEHSDKEKAEAIDFLYDMEEILNILDKKKVQIDNLKYYILKKSQPREFYNSIFNDDSMYLTEKEYELLKDWLNAY